MNNFGRKLAEKIGINVQGGTVHVGEIRLDNEMSRQEFRNRQALLNLVKTAWVEGVLEKSLHEQIPIVLGLKKDPRAVASPWNFNFIKTDQEPEPLPAGTPVIDVFDKLGVGGTLLILGEPGSGKTITLLQLARDLIKRAEDDGSCRIPVVLNLSSWAAGKQTIAQWIVEELNSKYQINRKIGKQWVEKQELLLLLDGLDEIRDLEKRKACVMALNTFQQGQATEMVVCCRVQDYGKLGNKLRLQSALALQPLTTDQIQGYLNSLQSNLAVLKTLLTEDTTLQELAQSPLLLNIMVLTYQEIKFTDIPIAASNSNRKQQLFDKYIDCIFHNPRLLAYHSNSQFIVSQSYSHQDIKCWLVWMAQKMVWHSTTIFLVEKIQPYWLQRSEMFIYRIGTVLNITVIFGLIFLTYGLTIGKPLEWLFLCLIFGLIFGLTYEPILGLNLQIESTEYLNWSWKEFKKKLSRNLNTAVISGLITSLVIGLNIWLTSGLVTGLLAGSTFGFLTWIIVLFLVCIKSGYTNSVKPTLHPNQGIKMSSLTTLSFMLVVGIVLLLNKMIDPIINDLPYFSLYLSICGGTVFIMNLAERNSWNYVVIFIRHLLFGLIYGLFYGLIYSLEVGLVVGFVVGLILIPISLVKKNIYVDQSIIAIYTLVILNLINLITMCLTKDVFGLFLMLAFGTFFGGWTCVQHFTLRMILFFKGHIPWNYFKFLDWASDKLFLQKVGGGYIFIHRSLMEHFAEMDNIPNSEKV